jgi:hypothetical protein
MRSAAEHLIYRFSKPASKSKKAARVRKEGKAATHREETARIREAVFQRAGGKCELCPWIPPRDATELHHMEGGAGRRREKQAISNCVALCFGCHRDYHNDTWEFHGRVVAWALRTGNPLPSYFQREAATPAALVPKEEAAGPCLYCGCCGNAPAHDALAAGEHKEEGSDAAAGTPSPEAPGDG